MGIFLALTAVLIPLLLNAIATWIIVRDVLSDRRQKIAQLLLVWIIPFIGAITVLAVHRRTEPRPYREAAEPGDDFAYSGRMTKGIKDILDGDD